MPTRDRGTQNRRYWQLHRDSINERRRLRYATDEGYRKRILERNRRFYARRKYWAEHPTITIRGS